MHIPKTGSIIITCRSQAQTRAPDLGLRLGPRAPDHDLDHDLDQDHNLDHDLDHDDDESGLVPPKSKVWGG